MPSGSAVGGKQRVVVGRDVRRARLLGDGGGLLVAGAVARSGGSLARSASSEPRGGPGAGAGAGGAPRRRGVAEHLRQ